jgi:class 3 adenylate cyclase
MGDSVLAVFPEERTAAAVASALRMRKEFARLARESGTGVDSDLGIAIGRGPVIHGIFGHSSLRTEDVFGETVNETAMLLQARGVVLSREAREAAGDQFPLEKLPDVILKWRPEPLEAWRVIEAG